MVAVRSLIAKRLPLFSLRGKFAKSSENLYLTAFESWIFFVLSLLGIRQWLARMMPQSLVMAVGAGIGLFIAFIGLCEF
jgi:AGZA family xanthine/uracil permease-like MFS transporter